MLEFDGNCQNGQSSGLNRFSTSFICSVFDGTVAESKSTDQLSHCTNYHLVHGKNLQLILSESTVHLILRFKLILQNLFSELIFYKGTSRYKAHNRLYITQGLIIPCTSPCNTPILPVRKPKGQRWRFVWDIQAINNIVIPWHPVPEPRAAGIYPKWKEILHCNSFM